MSVDWDRRVIPIWRNSSLSSTLPETQPLIKSGGANRNNNNLDLYRVKKSLSTWDKDKTIGGAADLLNFSHITSFRETLTAPAEYIIKEARNVPETLRIIAHSILNPDSPSVEVIKENIHENFDVFRAEASSIKSRLLLDPKNSIALIDLARVYAAQGQKDKAELAVMKALYLTPNHRFVVRSAARFLLHIGEPEKAAYYVGKVQSLPSDPWLLATHIALDTILNKTPRLLKKSLEIIKSNNLSPLQVTELASSVATFEAFKGDFKSAKRNFGSGKSLSRAWQSEQCFGKPFKR